MRPTTTDSPPAFPAMERDAKQLAERLRRSHEELDHFVRALSHDMSANFMLLDNSFCRLKAALGAEQRLRPDLGQLVSHMEACLRESQRFLNDLVGFARTGRIDMDPQPTEVDAVLQEVLFEQRDLLAQRRIEVDIQGPLPTVWCNRHRLKQVLTNLLRNAAKHGCDPQEPRITISSALRLQGTSEENAAGLVSFQVHDNGPGIPAEYREEVFLPGRRLPQAQQDGSGMGLAIVRRIAEHYGGSVRIAEDPLGGATFVVCLPAPPPGASRPTAPVLPRGRDLPHESHKPHSPLSRSGKRGRVSR